MFIISNKQMKDILRYVEEYRRRVDVNTCDLKTYNAFRLSGILLRQLRAKQPLTTPDLKRQENSSLDEK